MVRKGGRGAGRLWGPNTQGIVIKLMTATSVNSSPLATCQE